MITNKQYKEDMRELLDIIYFITSHIDFTVWQKANYQKVSKFQSRLNAIPDEDEGSNLMFEPPKTTGHSNLILEPAKYKGGAQRVPKINNDRKRGAKATDDEINRYKMYVEYMNGLNNIALSFADWLVEDRKKEKPTKAGDSYSGA